MIDPTDINQQDIDEDEARQVRLAEQEQLDIKSLMASRFGRRLAYGFLERAGVFQSSFNCDPLVMAFNEGRRNEGLRLLGLINTICPEKYLTMMREHDEHRDTNN